MYYVIAVFCILFFLKTITFKKLHKVNSNSIAFWNSVRFIFFIFLQQVALFLLWTMLATRADHVFQIAAVSFIFALFHLRFFFNYRKIEGYLLTFSGLLGGAVFAYLYDAYYLVGVSIAFLVHVGFHILLDILFIVYGGRPMKEYKKNI